MATSSLPASLDRKLDAELLARAFRKLMDKQELTKEEKRALSRHEREKEERLRWQYYQSIPQKHWREMSGRQSKVINEQAQPRHVALRHRLGKARELLDIVLLPGRRQLRSVHGSSPPIALNRLLAWLPAALVKISQLTQVAHFRTD